MKSILEYISIYKRQSKIKATDDTIREIVKNELDRLGHDADLNHIDVSECKNFNGLFSAKDNDGGPSQPKRLGKKYKDINPDISKWDTKNVTTFDGLFLGCENFNTDLSKWNTQNVKIMSYTFCCCYSFNSDISMWDLSSCVKMNGMFSFAKNFDCDISKWDVSNVWDMEYTFCNAISFSHNLRNWNTKNVTSHKECFQKCSKNIWPYNKRPIMK